VLVEVSALMTSHLLTRKHTGRFTPRPRLVGRQRRPPVDGRRIPR
jgi:hypothetical protein